MVPPPYAVPCKPTASALCPAYAHAPRRWAPAPWLPAPSRSANAGRSTRPWSATTRRFVAYYTYWRLIVCLPNSHVVPQLALLSACSVIRCWQHCCLLEQHLWLCHHHHHRRRRRHHHYHHHHRRRRHHHHHHRHPLLPPPQWLRNHVRHAHLQQQDRWPTWCVHHPVLWGPLPIPITW